MRLTRAFAAALFALSSGCAGPSATDETALNEAAKQAAQQRLDAYIAAALADSVDQLAGYWTETAKVYEPEMSIDGRAAMMAMITEVMKSMKFSSATLHITDAFAHDGGTVVYQYGEIDETLTPRDGKSPPTRARLFITFRWVKSTDGAWRIDRLMETPMPALAAGTKDKK